MLEGAWAQPYPSLGILYIASFLREVEDWQIGVFDATFADGEAAFKKTLKKLRPRVVGIQSLLTTRRSAHCMIDIAKQIGTIVVVGGPDPSVCYDKYLHWGADFVVLGEGELTMYELMKYSMGTSEVRACEEIPGIVYWDGEEIRCTEPREPIPDLDIIPFPAYDLIDVEHYLDTWRIHNGYASMHIVTSRGCPFQCQWCSHAVFGRSFRQRPVQNVVDELRLLEEHYAPEHLTIADDTFALNRKWLCSWCDEVERRRFGFHFRCFSRADIVDPEILEHLKRAGCSHIHLGVESGSQRVLDWMHKGSTVQDIRRASRQIKRAGIGLGYFIMFAYPGETRNDIRKTEQLIFEENPESLGLSIAHPVPGTPFYESVKDSLVPTDEDADEQMGSGRQLRFRATYPGAYYRRLIRCIERRRAVNQLNLSPIIRLAKALRTAIDLVILRAIEWFWPILSHKQK